MDKYKIVSGNTAGVEKQINIDAAQGYRPVQMTANTYLDRANNTQTTVVVLLEIG